MKLKMGELSKMTGIAQGTIIYYEKSGMLNPSWRTSGRFRLYDDYLIERLRFIRICRQQGLKFEKIRQLLDFRECPAGKGAPTDKDLEERIKKTERELHQLSSHLEELKAMKRAVTCSFRHDCATIREKDLMESCATCARTLSEGMEKPEKA